MLYSKQWLRASMLTVLALAAAQDPSKGLYKIGAGIGDITGPAVETMMMGYAKPGQYTSGIHMRLYSRAFIVDDGKSRLAYVSIDAGMTGQLVKLEVLEGLSKIFGATYNSSNVIISAIHTHSGPGGYLQYALFDISTLGFIHQSFKAQVDGIVKSIQMAHNNLVPGRMYLSVGKLLDASINRSPTSYLRNPAKERSLYEHDTDKNMTLVKMVAEDGTPIGMINWFAVHPTSMNNTNTLISGDNKGYASQLFEQAINHPDDLPGHGPFVAAFAQANCGDVSPNLQGPKCQDTGLPCDLLTSTCHGRNEKCYAQGPGHDMVESTKIIAKRQFLKAMELYKDPKSKMITGPIQFISQQVDMSDETVTLSDGTKKKTCLPALGYSFAAGTTDGPGEFDFTQGTIKGNKFWNILVRLIKKTSRKQIACHAPKPVLLSTGEYHFPYEWHPKIVETQVGRIGQLLILAVPGEFTTMSGRRLRNKAVNTIESKGVKDAVAVISGLSNAYSHYIATYEEYQAQRYEAASTIYGPHTLEAYLQKYDQLVSAMAQGSKLPSGPVVPDLRHKVIDIQPRVIYDLPKFRKHFGDVLKAPPSQITAGNTVSATFVAGNPRNNLMLNGTFLTVEKQSDRSSWKIVATDASWETKFHWLRLSSLLGTSSAKISWSTGNAEPGSYRICHQGYHKPISRHPKPYHGCTKTFKVVASKVNSDWTLFHSKNEETLSEFPFMKYRM